MAEERIQKIMSEQGLCSRRAAEQIIAEGRVKVNGHPVKVGDKMDPNRDVLHVDDERIYIQKNQQMYYLALYKPRGYVTTASDELGRKTVMELVSDIPARLYPVGRLDKDSEGLLLMTNDGAFAQAVTHPSGGISKLYRVTVQPRADESQILKMSSGVVLDDGTKTMPCAINVVTDEPGRTVMEMTLKEGKNREIRRMCEAVGLEVVRLKRNAEGVVKLGMLKPGTYRELTKAEVSGLRAAAAKGRLDNDRIPHFFCNGQCFFCMIQRFLASRDHRYPCRDHRISGIGFIAEFADDICVWSDENNMTLLT